MQIYRSTPFKVVENLKITICLFPKALGNVYAAFELEPDAKFKAIELPTEYNNVHIPKEIAIPTQSSTLQSIHKNREHSDLNEIPTDITDQTTG